MCLWSGITGFSILVMSSHVLNALQIHYEIYSQLDSLIRA